MACWLMKTEPDVYGVDDLRRDRRTGWEGVRNYLDALPAVVNWMYVLPNTFLVVTALSAKGLAGLMEEVKPEPGRFLVLATSGERAGWMAKKGWDLIKNPEMILR